MGSAAKFWPTRLFSRTAKSDAQSAFVPTTDLAARIVGVRSADKPSVPPDRLPSETSGDERVAGSFDLDDLTFGDDETSEAPSADVDANRQSDRFVPDKTATTLTDQRGKVFRCRVINLSATGVAIEADFRSVPPDTVTMIGAKPVKPGRAIRGGHVFLFDKPLDPARSNKQIIL